MVQKVESWKQEAGEKVQAGKAEGLDLGGGGGGGMGAGDGTGEELFSITVILDLLTVGVEGREIWELGFWLVCLAAQGSLGLSEE